MGEGFGDPGHHKDGDEGTLTQMQKWAKPPLPGLSSCPRAWDTCAMRTKSQATHPPEPSWAQSHPALTLASPGQRTWHLHQVQTGSSSLQGLGGCWPDVMRAVHLPAAQLMMSSQGLSLSFSDAVKLRAMSYVAA